MKLLPSICLILIGLSSFAQKNETTVDQLHRKKFTWLINKQYDSLYLVLHNQVQYIHSNGWVQAKKEVIDDLTTGKLNYTNIEVLESKVTIYKSTAVVTGKGNFRGLMPDKSEFNLSLCYTEVYVKVGKQWMLLNRLATKITL
ncbi:MAG: nuclear transport factor 2 family protein [Cyclobacteriaceae bacterium]|nr:nuclear transport factor 2 family protein [Cyclobacteriaceae bacterium]